MKIFEFVNDSNYLIDKMEELIYFDEKWMFPQYNIIEFLEVDSEVPNDFIKIGNKIVNELNRQNVDPDKYEKSDFFNILESL